MVSLKIADLVIDVVISEDITKVLEDCDERSILHDSFFDFEYEKDENEQSDLEWKVRFIDDKEDDNKKFGECVYCVENDVLRIYKKNDRYTYEYRNKNEILKVIHCDDDFQKCTFCLCLHDKEKMKEKDIVERVSICLYNMFREMFFYATNLKKMFSVHSASIIYKNKAYLFSAPSGVGKSTHTNMWKDYYNVEILDGDVAMCRVMENYGVKKAFAYGMPWCGTSGLYLNKKVELAGIIFLKRGNENKIKKIDKKEIGKKLFCNSFTKRLNESVVDGFVDGINEVAEQIDGYILECLPNKEAVDMVINTIDEDRKE